MSGRKKSVQHSKRCGKGGGGGVCATAKPEETFGETQSAGSDAETDYSVMANVASKARRQTAIEQKLKHEGDRKANAECVARTRMEKVKALHVSMRQLLNELETETSTSFDSVRIAYNLRLAALFPPH